MKRSVFLVLAGLLVLAPAPGSAPGRVAEAPRELLVVVDAGHGGPDHGAKGPAGALEKDVVLAVARRIGRALEARGFRAVQTRTEDVFVALPERTARANEARADVYLSIHANSAPDRSARGTETYFLSLEASDEEAMRVAMIENEVFSHPGAADDGRDVVGRILGDLIRTEHLRESSALAAAIQRNLARLPGPSRGVKQAPFVVLMGVNMPAALVEIGFLTHPGEERNLRSGKRQQAIADAVAEAVAKLRDEGALRRSAAAPGGRS